MATNSWTDKDIPDQSGRTAVVTGANSGLGFETSRALASRGAHVVLAVRSTDNGEDAADRIRHSVPDAELTVQQLDLASLDSVREAADVLKQTFPAIDLLVNNAGVMYPPKLETAEGFELQFGVNHLGTFAFTGQLLDNVLTVPDSRIVTVSSVAHQMRAEIHFDDLQWERSFDTVAAYGQSKLSNLLFAYELQHRLKAAGADAISVAAHPGVSDTALFRYLPGPVQKVWPAVRPVVSQPAAKGALPSLRAATDPDVFGGQYFGPRGPGGFRGAPVVVSSTEQTHDRDLQRRLWDVSGELTGVTFPV
ncbi:MAG: SDR family NAD(P)-dependent oxidoreductase [Mycobacteriaceae bacterium]|uniref:SDR family NAD(P)-dependent oxidoreductase n=1 Tax=Corynebacterium sp. TaxID=1720 RepID=UPI003F94698B